MAKEKPLTERPEWLPNDGPRYLVSLETAESCPGTKTYRGFFETEKYEDALLECSTAAKEEGKETIVWDRWEFQMVHKEAPPAGTACEKATKKTREFLLVNDSGTDDGAGTSNGEESDGDEPESRKPTRSRKSKKR